MRASPVDIKWHSGMSIYASEPFMKAVGDEYGWLGGINESGALRCVLPYTVIRKAGFNLVRFRVETIPLIEEFDVGEERSFLNSAVEYFRSTEVDMVIPASNNTIFRTYPDGAVVAPYGNIIIDLNKPEETLWSNLHSKHRNVIRNAMKKGVKIKSGIEHLETAFGLVRDSFSRSASGFIGRMRVGFRMDYDAFRNQVLSLGDHVKVFVAEYEGVVQGCAVIPFSNHSAYYMHGGSIQKPLTGAMNLLQWEAIRQCRELGVRHYDFFGCRIYPEKGSKAEGIMKFKERFGGQMIQGFMWKFPFRPVKYYIYSLTARVRSGGDVVDQECHKLHKT